MANLKRLVQCRIMIQWQFLLTPPSPKQPPQKIKEANQNDTTHYYIYKCCYDLADWFGSMFGSRRAL